LATLKKTDPDALFLGRAEPQLGREERRVKQKERRVKN
jgi:hypothetical protein